MSAPKKHLPLDLSAASMTDPHDQQVRTHCQCAKAVDEMKNLMREHHRDVQDIKTMLRAFLDLMNTANQQIGNHTASRMGSSSNVSPTSSTGSPVTHPSQRVNGRVKESQSLDATHGPRTAGDRGDRLLTTSGLVNKAASNLPSRGVQALPAATVASTTNGHQLVEPTGLATHYAQQHHDHHRLQQQQHQHQHLQRHQDSQLAAAAESQVVSSLYQSLQQQQLVQAVMRKISSPQTSALPCSTSTANPLASWQSWAAMAATLQLPTQLSHQQQHLFANRPPQHQDDQVSTLQGGMAAAMGGNGSNNGGIGGLRPNVPLLHSMFSQQQNGTSAAAAAVAGRGAPPRAGGLILPLKREVSSTSGDSALGRSLDVKRRRFTVDEARVLQLTSSERKKGVPDDFVKELVDKHGLLRVVEDDAHFIIPVPEATACDPEEQIVGSSNWVDLGWPENVSKLAKRLAEKRVFGPVLMAKATVAGTNHSNYENLPEQGILYISSVCRRVLKPDIPTEKFGDFFRPAIKGLAARCRRIRHSMKPCVGSQGDPLPSSVYSALSRNSEDNEDDLSD